MKHQNKTPSAGKQLGASRKNQWRYFTAAMAKELAPWLIAAVAATAIVQCTHPPARGKVPVALKGAGASKHHFRSGSNPHRQAGFYHVQIQGGCIYIQPARFWAGWGYPQGRPHGYGRVLNIPPTINCFKTEIGGFLNVPVGA